MIVTHICSFYFIASNITPDYWQRIDYFMLLSIVNDYEKITGKNSIMSACNLSYRLKRSGPKVSRDQFLYKFSESVEKSKGHSQLRPKQPPQFSQKFGNLVKIEVAVLASNGYVPDFFQLILKNIQINF